MITLLLIVLSFGIGAFGVGARPECIHVSTGEGATVGECSIEESDGTAPPAVAVDGTFVPNH